jgi:hypothetical protein
LGPRHHGYEGRRAIFGREKGAQLGKGPAHLGSVGGSHPLHEQRQPVGLKMLGVQLHVGEQVARQIAAGPAAVQGEIALGILARERALGREQHAVLDLQEPQGPRSPIQPPRLGIGRQSVERLLEFPVRIVPNHNAPPSRPGKRLVKSRQKALPHINFGHWFSL